MIVLNNNHNPPTETYLQSVYQKELEDSLIDKSCPQQLWINAHPSFLINASTKSQKQRHEYSLYPFVWTKEDPNNETEQEKCFYRLMLDSEQDATLPSEDSFNVALMLEAADHAQFSGGDALASDIKALKSLQELFIYAAEEIRAYTQVKSSKLGYVYQGTSRGAFCFDRLDYHYNTLRDALKDMSDEYRFT